uniref:BZIP domain-containing protein n=1 Tax=Ciona savignyi TaxID=51511 RepID=H2ZLQ8_CIOSA
TMMQRFSPGAEEENKQGKDYWMRRRKNNEAARRSREKRRMNDLLLERRVLQLTEENKQLRGQLVALKIKYGETDDIACYTWPEDSTNDANHMDGFSSQQFDASLSKMGDEKGGSWKRSSLNTSNLVTSLPQFSSRVFTNATGDTSATVLVNESVMSNSASNFPMLHLDQRVPFCLPQEDVANNDFRFSFPSSNDEEEKTLGNEEVAEFAEDSKSPEPAERTDSFARLNSLLRKTFPPSVAIALGALYSRYSNSSVANQATADFLLGGSNSDKSRLIDGCGIPKRAAVPSEKKVNGSSLERNPEALRVRTPKDNFVSVAETEIRRSDKLNKDKYLEVAKGRRTHENQEIDTLKKLNNFKHFPPEVERYAAMRNSPQKRKSSFQLPHKLRLKKASMQHSSLDETELDMNGETELERLSPADTRTRESLLQQDLETENAAKFRRFSYSDQETIRRMCYKDKEFSYFRSLKFTGGNQHRADEIASRDRQFSWQNDQEKYEFEKFRSGAISRSLNALSGLARDKIPSNLGIPENWWASRKLVQTNGQDAEMFSGFQGKLKGHHYLDSLRAKQSNGGSMFNHSNSLQDPLVAV